jgi:hypothetical protein
MGCEHNALYFALLKKKTSNGGYSNSKYSQNTTNLLSIINVATYFDS